MGVRHSSLVWAWLIACAIPLLTLLAFALIPETSPLAHLIRGIILACEAVFLAKWVGFKVISHHLHGNHQAKKQVLWLLLVPLLLAIYLLHYFGLFNARS